MEEQYKLFLKRKKDGSMREIYVPNPELKARLKILNTGFDDKYIHKCATGFRPKSDILTTMKLHKDSNIFMAFDLKSFFDTISRATIERVLKETGQECNDDLFMGDRIVQGAPTSPYLSNLVLYDFDEMVHILCGERGYTYTRYADDLIISKHSDAFSPSEVEIDYNEIKETLKLGLVELIPDSNIRLKESKSKCVILDSGDSFIALGVRITSGKDGIVMNTRRRYNEDLTKAIKFETDKDVVLGKLMWFLRINEKGSVDYIKVERFIRKVWDRSIEEYISDLKGKIKVETAETGDWELKTTK